MPVSSKHTDLAEARRRRPVPVSAEEPLRTVDRPEARRSSVWLATRFLGAFSLLVVGGVHLQQYDYLYSTIPTIGTLFLLNFVGATVLALGLLAPVERVLGRLGEAALALLALGGIGLAATAFVFLLISERTPLFGFMEPGYDPTAIMTARVSEIVTVSALGVYLAARFGWKKDAGSW